MTPQRPSLTHRENEVLSFILHGFTGKMISTRLEISIRTVEQHLANMKRKLGIHSKKELIEIYFNK